MSDHNWFEWVMGGAMAIAGFILKHVWHKAHDSVSRSELQEVMNQNREDRLRMHAENREDLQYIRERLDDLRDRRQ